MPTYIKSEDEFYQLTDYDIESVEIADGDIRLTIDGFDNRCIYLSKEDLLHLLKLIGESN